MKERKNIKRKEELMNRNSLHLGEKAKNHLLWPKPPPLLSFLLWPLSDRLWPKALDMLSARLWPLSERLWPIKPPPDSVRLWVNMLELEPFLLCPLVDAISSFSSTSSRPSASFLPKSSNYGPTVDIFGRVLPLPATKITIPIRLCPASN